MKTQIPVYRVKTLDGEWIEGLITWDSEFGCERIIQREKAGTSIHSFDPETLAIHFPDMNDKNGERIFAALNDSGVGGSVVIYSDVLSNVKYKDTIIYACSSDRMFPIYEYIEIAECKVTGIYEGETK
jgi:hypothetical protein